MGFFKKIGRGIKKGFRSIKKAKIGRFLKTNIKSAANDVKKAKVGRFIKKWGLPIAATALTIATAGGAAPAAAGAIKGAGLLGKLGKVGSLIGKGKKLLSGGKLLAKASKLGKFGRLVTKGANIVNKFKGSKVGTKVFTLLNKAKTVKGAISKIGKAKNGLGKLGGFLARNKKTNKAIKLVEQTLSIPTVQKKLVPNIDVPFGDLRQRFSSSTGITKPESVKTLTRTVTTKPMVENKPTVVEYLKKYWYYAVGGILTIAMGIYIYKRR